MAALEAFDLDAMQHWGPRIRARRKRLRLTQAALAARLEEQNPGMRIDQGKVSLWETGARRPTDEQRVALTRALNLKHVTTLFSYGDGR